MRLYPFLCLEGTEITFGDRTQTYVRSGLAGPGWQGGSQYDCDLLRDGDTFLDPASDDAPWYDANVSYSDEFMGVAIETMDLITPYSRTTENDPNGGWVSSVIYRPYVLQCVGWMIASSALGMSYGDKWLREVLRGSLCDDGYSIDSALILPACPTEGDPTPEEYLRYLLNVGTIDGPNFGRIQNTPECSLVPVTFQMAAGIPFMYSPPITVVDGETMSTDSSSPTCGMISTNDWPGDAVANITLVANSDATGIHLSGGPTFDGNCPDTMRDPCWTMDVPYLPMDGKLFIDSRRQAVRYTDPSLAIERSGLRMTRYTPPVTYPEIAPCSDFCVCAWAESGDVSITVDKHIREV